MQRGHIEPEMVAHLVDALGTRLDSVVLYGPAAANEGYREHSEGLLIVLTDLEPATLRAAAAPVRWWLKRTHVWPRLFTRELITRSVDVFPIELLDIAQRRRVLFGDDPFAGVVVDPVPLRMQCERELREKLMRLREGYIEAHIHRGGDQLRELLAASFAPFARIFRACLSLMKVPLPPTDRAVIATLCDWLELEREPFFEVERLARGEDIEGDLEAVFVAYYGALSSTEARIDRLLVQQRSSS
jgi:hypothetical protein